MDATNAGTPAAGGQLSGEVTRNAAVKRLQRLQAVKQTASPNTGPTGIPKPEASILQKPTLASQSSTPQKPRRI
jgi:hypothetical protein